LIDIDEAIQIARQTLEQPVNPAGVLESETGYVIGFRDTDLDEYANLTVLVDRSTGQPEILSAGEYLTLLPTLHRVF
jgi:hypothetical protein